MMKGMTYMLDNFELPNETIDKVYDDAVHPAASEAGKFAGRIPRLINAALAPLDCWILKREHHIEKTKQLLEENLKNADPEKIVTPEPYVAVPAIQALSYSMDSDELRALYANLLAKSIYADTKDSVHPAFTEIIKNLSPLDCRVFEFIMQSKYHEIGYYEFRVGSVDDRSYYVAFPYVTSITFADIEKVATSINNLSRNMLITPRDFRFTDDTRYSDIRNTDFYKSVCNAFSSHPENQELRPYKKSIKATPFGRSFYDVCSVPL